MEVVGDAQGEKVGVQPQGESYPVLKLVIGAKVDGAVKPVVCPAAEDIEVVSDIGNIIGEVVYTAAVENFAVGRETSP